MTSRLITRNSITKITAISLVYAFLGSHDFAPSNVSAGAPVSSKTSYLFWTKKRKYVANVGARVLINIPHVMKLHHFYDKDKPHIKILDPI